MSTKQTLFYIHGGGYVLGQADDLPPQLDQFLNQHFNLVALAYPLAPQVQHDDIINFCINTINNYIQTHKVSDYLLMGRSAGANIVLSMDADQLITQPSKIISFYGYDSSDINWMTQGITNLELPASKSLLDIYQKDTTVTTHRDVTEHYPYYYTLRQTGLWPSVVGLTQSPITFDPLTPIYICHSMFDPDVPFHCSKSIRQHFINNKITISTLKKHSIDHDPKECDKIIEALLQFIQT